MNKRELIDYTLGIGRSKEHGDTMYMNDDHTIGVVPHSPDWEEAFTTQDSRDADEFMDKNILPVDRQNEKRSMNISGRLLMDALKILQEDEDYPNLEITLYPITDSCKGSLLKLCTDNIVVYVAGRL